MKKVFLLSFADSNYIHSLDRIKTETANFPFSERFFYTEKDFPNEFRQQLHYKKHRRGYGYWRWKSYLVKRIFDSLNYGDIIVWTDAGNSWNINGIKRFKEYLDLVETIESGILVFEQPFLEKDYSKGDLLEYLNVYTDDNVIMSLQLWGGCFIIRKTSISIAFLEEWEGLHCNHYDLITDKKSKKSNLCGFIENRHDQSSFSIIVKKYPRITISYKEVYDVFQKWNDMIFFPIHGKRLRYKDCSLWGSLKKRFLLPYRYFLGLYLVVFERMYFRDKFWY